MNLPNLYKQGSVIIIIIIHYPLLDGIPCKNEEIEEPEVHRTLGQLAAGFFWDT